VPGSPQQGGDCEQDNSFESSEALYRRFSREHIEMDGQLRAQNFSGLPGTSVNRGKYSDPDHVLHPDCADGKCFTLWGVCSFQVEDVAAQIYELEDDGRKFRFVLQHVPLPTCKAHSEIGCIDFHSGKQLDRLPKKIKNRFRIFLAQRVRVIIEPAA
jgi:hypothetical protein